MEEETGFKRLKCKAALSKTKLTKDHFLLVETCYIFFEVTHYTTEEVQKICIYSMYHDVSKLSKYLLKLLSSPKMEI